MIVLAGAVVGFAAGAVAVLAYLRYLARHEDDPWATALGLFVFGGGIGGAVGAVLGVIAVVAVCRAMGW